MRRLNNIITTALLITLHTISSVAQSRFINQDTKADRHHFLVTGSYLTFINHPDVNTLIGNKKFLTANNTNGYQVGVAYEYTNKYNVSFTALTTYGKQKHDIEWRFRFDNFDPRADFGDYTATYRYNSTIPYLNTSLLIGYELRPFIRNKMKIQAKAGLGIIHYFKWDNQKYKHIISYKILDSSGNVNNVEHAYTDASSGSQGSWYSQRNVFYNLYLGITYPLDSKIFKEYRIGIAFTHVTSAFSPSDDNFNRITSSYYNFVPPNTLARDGHEEYKNKFRTIALTASIGF